MKCPIRTLTILAAALIWAFPCWSRAIEPEPNWSNRFEEVRQKDLAAFVPPKVGDQFILVRRIGGEIAGKITGLNDVEIALDGKRFQPAQLIPENAQSIFPKIHAMRIASDLVQQERADYNTRKQVEIELAKDEARQQAEQKLESERQEAKAAEQTAWKEHQARQRETTARAKVTPEADASQAATRYATGDQPRQKQQESGDGATFGTILLITAILLIPLYILPSIIACNRGHDNAGAIVALNLLLGWTFLGWVASLVWSLTHQESRALSVTVNVPPMADGSPRKKLTRIVPTH